MSKFICMWDMHGIERVIDITDFESEDEQNLMSVISTGQPIKSKFHSLLQGMLVRATYNNQRNYEIYAISTDDGITCEQIVDMFNQSPECAANSVRACGIKVF